jgi:hypothetical protein
VRVATRAVLLVGCVLAGALACSAITSWDGLELDAPADAGEGEGDGGSAPGSCEAGAYRCGGDGVVGDPSTLYRCLPDGGATPAIPCARGCTRRPGRSGACICVVGTRYCGNDQVVGDPAVLYECESDYSGKVIQRCDAGCRVATNAEDDCLRP